MHPYVNLRGNSVATNKRPKSEGEDIGGDPVVHVGKPGVSFSVQGNWLGHPEMLLLVTKGAIHGRVEAGEKHSVDLESRVASLRVDGFIDASWRVDGDLEVNGADIVLAGIGRQVGAEEGHAAHETIRNVENSSCEDPISHSPPAVG